MTPFQHSLQQHRERMIELLNMTALGREILRAEETSKETPKSGKGGKARRAQKRRRNGTTKPLTGLQQHAVTLYAQHNGSIKRVALAMGIGHATVNQHLKAAWRKIPNIAPKGNRAGASVKTQDLPHDDRGQVSAAGDKRRR